MEYWFFIWCENVINKTSRFLTHLFNVGFCISLSFRTLINFLNCLLISWNIEWRGMDFRVRSELIIALLSNARTRVLRNLVTIPLDYILTGLIDRSNLICRNSLGKRATSHIKWIRLIKREIICILVKRIQIWTIIF